MANAAGDTPASFRGTASRGLAAGFAQQAARVLLQIASTVVLARLLTASDFGVFAMVTPLIAFFGLFQDFGLQSALIQRQDVSDEQINRLYWLNLAFTLVIAVLLVAIAPLVGWFYGDPRTAALTMAWAIPVLLGGLASQQYALLARSFKFATLAALDIVCALTGFATAVIVALLVHSYWALWASAVTMSAMWVATSFHASGWRPSAPSFRGGTDGMLGFGLNVTGTNVLYFFMRNLDNLLIGRRWGAQMLGLYDRAYKLLLFPLQNINAPVMRVVTPILSRMQDEKDRLARAYLRIVILVCLAAVPGMAAALAAPNELVGVLLGPSWMGVVPIFVWLGVAGLVQPLLNTVSWLLTAQARTGELLRYSVAAGIVTIAAFIMGLPDGAVGVARAYAVSEILFRTPLMLWLACRGNPINAGDFAKVLTPLLVAALMTVVSVQVLQLLHLPPVVLLIAAVLISYGLATALIAAFSTGRASLGEGWAVLAQALSRFKPSRRRL